jgi:hypothetical protein
LENTESCCAGIYFGAIQNQEDMRICPITVVAVMGYFDDCKSNADMIISMWKDK